MYEYNFTNYDFKQNLEIYLDLYNTLYYTKPCITQNQPTISNYLLSGNGGGKRSRRRAGHRKEMNTTSESKRN